MYLWKMNNTKTKLYAVFVNVTQIPISKSMISLPMHSACVCVCVQACTCTCVHVLVL